jgi:hypothetical protein
LEHRSFFPNLENWLPGGSLAAQYPGPLGTRLGFVLDHRLADSPDARSVSKQYINGLTGI